ncbi:hypothetical protein DIZ76_014170 [Coccidioides immitis]|nr:hypothetical protein DIZ76_014170 [Coccidioides immitis]
MSDPMAFDAFSRLYSRHTFPRSEFGQTQLAVGTHSGFKGTLELQTFVEPEI